MNSRTSIYRQIRAQRTWRPLGKMSWWRVGVGLAASGRFEAAERMIISRAWMERYKPESMRFIQAGALYERGEEEAARELLGSINPSDLSEGEALEYQVLREELEPGQT